MEYFENNFKDSTIFVFLISTYLRKQGECQKCITYLIESIKRCEDLKIAPNLYIWELG
jgi:hypothetical protein